MNINVKAGVAAPVLLMVLFMFDSNIRGQDATPSPSPSASEPAADKAKSDAQAEPKAAAAKPAQMPEPDFWHRKN